MRAGALLNMAVDGGAGGDRGVIEKSTWSYKVARSALLPENVFSL